MAKDDFGFTPAELRKLRSLKDPTESSDISTRALSPGRYRVVAAPRIARKHFALLRRRDLRRRRACARWAIRR